MGIMRQDAMFEERAEPTTIAPVFSKDELKEEAFKHYRSTGFPWRRIPLYLRMQEVNKLATMNMDRLLTTGTGYATADSYHPQRFKAKTLEALQSPYDCFHDDRMLRKALDLYLNHDIDLVEGYWSGLNFARGTRPPFNFRPGVAVYTYRTMAPTGSTVFDPCAGYGGRLLGAIASRSVARYIAIDANAETVEGNRAMAADLGKDIDVSVTYAAAEDVPAADVCDGEADLVFTSPPYFNKELYSHESTQSWVRYKTFEEWVSGFLEPMMRLSFDALRPGRFAVLNVADFKVHNKEYIPLTNRTIQAGLRAGFVFHGPASFGYTRPTWQVKRKTAIADDEIIESAGTKQTDKIVTEPFLVFRKLEGGR